MVHTLAAIVWCLLWLWISFTVGQERARATWSVWTDWGACCLNKQTRFRTCQTSGPEQTALDCEGNSELFRHCWGCPDKKLTPRISPWSLCSTTCGEGQMIRTVSCDLTEEQMIQFRCQPQISYVVTCLRRECQVDVQWSQWSHWGSCESIGDGVGISNRTRSCINALFNDGGKTCAGTSVETKKCVLCQEATNPDPIFTDMPQIFRNQQSASNAEESGPNQSNSDSKAFKNVLLIPSIIGSLGFIIAVLIVTAFVFRYLEKRRLRTTPYRMRKVRFEGDIKTIVLFPDSRNPFES